MRNYQQEFDSSVHFIRETVSTAGASGIVFGNSGGKDSALVGILCKAACDNTLGVIMPCGSSVNFGSDKNDAEALAKQFGIESRVVDLTAVRDILADALAVELSPAALNNIAPRLRMTALYAIAANENRLVAGTDNRSEIYIGYYTKWGDGAHDFNPIADLTVTEVYEFLRFLNRRAAGGIPVNIIEKAPSAGLFEGQTDEAEIGLSYQNIDEYLLYGKAGEKDKALIETLHAKTAHKRNMPIKFM
ncbi:MAG: NAD(+) synthase [Oscillospiraceae bacterium]|nr:NAD(+) synthase [Oscillospiraceae bacterium]